MSDPISRLNAALEGRYRVEGGLYWSTKIQNTDVLWFPRLEGEHPALGDRLLSGVRLGMPQDEYNLNPFVEALGGRNAFGTGCNPDEAPLL